MTNAKKYAEMMYHKCKENNVDISGDFFSTNNANGYAVYQDEVAREILGSNASEDSIAELIEDGDCEFADYFVDGEFGVNAVDGRGEWLPQYKY